MSEKSFENKFPSQKQVYVQVSVKETPFCQRKKFFHRNKFLSQEFFLLQTKFSVREKKLPSQKQVHGNLMYQDIALSSPKGKCVKKFRIL